MTQQVKPKQCGENSWYIPNQKGFVPEINGQYWFCGVDGGAYLSIYRSTYDYAMMEAGNCFNRKQEAIDAFVKTVDPTPLTWDEICGIADIGEYERVVMLISFVTNSCEWVDTHMLVYACDVRIRGRLHFEVNKYWRSKESLGAWIEQQKGE